MVSSFANNRTLADIYLDARHLLFIFSSCFLHVSSSCFLHVFPARYAGTEDFASARAAIGQAGSPACAAGRRVQDQLVQLTDRCLMPLIQPERGGLGRRVR